MISARQRLLHHYLACERSGDVAREPGVQALLGAGLIEAYPRFAIRKREHRRAADDAAQCTGDLMKLGIPQETALFLAEALAVEIAEDRPGGSEPQRRYSAKPAPLTDHEIVWRIWQNARHDVYGFAQAALFLRLVRKPSDPLTDLKDTEHAESFARDMWLKACAFNEVMVRRSEAADRRDEAER